MLFTCGITHIHLIERLPRSIYLGGGAVADWRTVAVVYIHMGCSARRVRPSATIFHSALISIFELFMCVFVCVEQHSLVCCITDYITKIHAALLLMFASVCMCTCHACQPGVYLCARLCICVCVCVCGYYNGA